MFAAICTYLALNALCFLCGFIWTMLDGKPKPNPIIAPMVQINYEKPGPYIFFGYTTGHLVARGLQELF